MSARTYTEEYFINKTEQAKIKSALTAAIPPDVTYYNLVAALADMQREWLHLAIADEVNHYDPNVSEARRDEVIR